MFVIFRSWTVFGQKKSGKIGLLLVLLLAFTPSVLHSCALLFAGHCKAGLDTSNTYPGKSDSPVSGREGCTCQSTDRFRQNGSLCHPSCAKTVACKTGNLFAFYKSYLFLRDNVAIRPNHKGTDSTVKLHTKQITSQVKHYPVWPVTWWVAILC